MGGDVFHGQILFPEEEDRPGLFPARGRVEDEDQAGPKAADFSGQAFRSLMAKKDLEARPSLLSELFLKRGRGQDAGAVVPAANIPHSQDQDPWCGPQFIFETDNRSKNRGTPLLSIRLQSLKR